MHFSCPELRLLLARVIHVLRLPALAVAHEKRICISLTPSCAFGLQGVIHVLRLPAYGVAVAAPQLNISPFLVFSFYLLVLFAL